MPSTAELYVLDHAPAASSLKPLHSIHQPSDYRFRFVRKPVGGALKRAMDVAVAGSALLVLAVPLAVIAVLVRMDSPGPSLFRQKRTGFRGRAFDVLKFRTMRRMENGAVITQATKNDMRVTRLGRFLRKTSLDELPQLINVLKGDMSLVGPRPHALAHDDAFWRINSAYPKRFMARPGITGLAQVSGHRGETDTPEKVEARLESDLAYVDRWSIFRDVGILIGTVALVLGDKNAY